MVRAAVLALVVVALGACARGETTPQSGDGGQQLVADAVIDGNGCATQPCSILPQCGCNGNTACDRNLANDPGCRPINVAGTETSTCGTSNECDRDYTCVGGSAFASCKKYCTNDIDCGAPRGTCFYTYVDGNDNPLPDIPKVCTSNCDPTDTAAAGCPSTMKCSLFFGTPPISDCTPAGTAVAGGSCNSATNTALPNNCAKSFTCVKFSTETTFACRRHCKNPDATAGANRVECGNKRCLPYNTPVTFGGDAYGVCEP